MVGAPTGGPSLNDSNADCAVAFGAGLYGAGSTTGAGIGAGFGCVGSLFALLEAPANRSLNLISPLGDAFFIKSLNLISPAGFWSFLAKLITSSPVFLIVSLTIFIDEISFCKKAASENSPSISTEFSPTFSVVGTSFCSFLAICCTKFVSDLSGCSLCGSNAANKSSSVNLRFAPS